MFAGAAIRAAKACMAAKSLEECIAQARALKQMAEQLERHLADESKG